MEQNKTGKRNRKMGWNFRGSKQFGKALRCIEQSPEGGSRKACGSAERAFQWSMEC